MASCLKASNIQLIDCKFHVADGTGAIYVFDKVITYNNITQTVIFTNGIDKKGFSFSDFIVNSEFTDWESFLTWALGSCVDVQLTEYEFEFACGEGFVTIIAKMNINTGIIEYLNLDNTPYIGDVFNCSTTIESDLLPICIDGVDAIKHYVKVNGEPNGEVYYTDVDNVIIATPTSYNLGECVTCAAAISQAFADDLSTLLPSHSYSFVTPKCCTVTIATSIGTFTIPSGVETLITKEFNCTFTINNVTVVGSCTLSDVQIIGSKLF